MFTLFYFFIYFSGYFYDFWATLHGMRLFLIQNLVPYYLILKLEKNPTHPHGLSQEVYVKTAEFGSRLGTH